ncbi:uncharacterized protein CPUR_07981 [Claviceps purpurea 20.1]|uniref:Uncharacterized protein n=1 Tax=Claviceps purpurea (strain 20.1) TaxID=1111077 RepID=M1WC88_CLAP2|nr:hypothetical protein E4U11_007675 [Claviceps purpurea]KAG6266316.1 hypothetical protein E4U47_005835 [Claviceps purpurea]CCE34050.1 uncharacterized protein CPUR_07981 [Claviceps purpurea 20.1]
MGVQLHKINNLPAVQDSARWVQLKTRVDGLENSLTDVQGAVTVTQGDFITLRNEVTTLRGEFTTFQNVFEDHITSIRESTQDQAEARIRLEALNKNTVARLNNRLSTRDALEPLHSLLTGREIEGVGSRAQLDMLLPRRMATILTELGQPRQVSVDDRRRELRKLYGAEYLNLRIIGEQEDD